MIVRSWSARATTEGGDAYINFFRQKVLPELHRIRGHRGAMVLRRSHREGVAVRVVTFWDSLEAIQAFAGSDVTAAVVEPEAKAVLQAFDTHVEHFDLVLDTRD